MDRITSAQRSLNMAKIRAKNTRPELIVRSLIHALGFRFRLHNRALPGTPDIILPKFRKIIDVRGCFWHLHRCKAGRVPATRKEYWGPKLARNRQRDRQAVRKLQALGW